MENNYLSIIIKIKKTLVNLTSLKDLLYKMIANYKILKEF